MRSLFFLSKKELQVFRRGIIMKESDAILQLAFFSNHTSRYEIMLPNVYTQHDNEVDLFCIRKSGYCDEFEVKLSRSDFLADKNKFVQAEEPTRSEEITFGWHNRHLGPSYKKKHEALSLGMMDVNYFWYAIKEGIAEVSDLPDFSGLIVISNDKGPEVIRRPKLLHRKKLSADKKYKIARKLSYRFWDLKNKLDL